MFNLYFNINIDYESFRHELIWLAKMWLLWWSPLYFYEIYGNLIKPIKLPDENIVNYF